MTSHRIAVLGAGVVGVNLARRFAELGHSVVFGARNPDSDKVRAALEVVGGSTVASHADAVAGADLAIIAVPFAAVDDIVAAIGDPGGTVLVDATNTVGAALPDGVDHIAELIHAAHPDAAVVKAFNTIGAEAFLDPTVGGQRYFLPIAGPEPAAELVRELAESMGFDALVVGDISSAGMLEDFARLWIHLAFRTGLGRDFGFVRVHSEAGDGD